MPIRQPVERFGNLEFGFWIKITNSPGEFIGVQYSQSQSKFQNLKSKIQNRYGSITPDPKEDSHFNDRIRI
jgi:hypothetical protein